MAASRGAGVKVQVPAGPGSGPFIYSPHTAAAHTNLASKTGCICLDWELEANWALGQLAHSALA